MPCNLITSSKQSAADCAPASLGCAYILNSSTCPPPSSPALPRPALITCDRCSLACAFILLCLECSPACRHISVTRGRSEQNPAVRTGHTHSTVGNHLQAAVDRNRIHAERTSSLSNDHTWRGRCWHSRCGGQSQAADGGRESLGRSCWPGGDQSVARSRRRRTRGRRRDRAYQYTG
jgi:hypothetical protein